MAAALSSSLPKLKGHVLMRVFDRGRLVETWDGENLVVTGAQQVAMEALIGSGGVITQIGFGIGSAPAALGNTGLIAPYLKALDSRTAVGGVASLAFSLAGSAVAGMTIWEFGLLTAANELVARKVRSAGLAMTADITLQGVWTLTFTSGS